MPELRRSTRARKPISFGSDFQLYGTTSMPELRRSTRDRKGKSFGSKFQLCSVEGTRDENVSQHQHCFNIEEDTNTFSEAMASRDVYFWKEKI